MNCLCLCYNQQPDEQQEGQITFLQMFEFDEFNELMQKVNDKNQSVTERYDTKQLQEIKNIRLKLQEISDLIQTKILKMNNSIASISNASMFSQSYLLKYEKQFNNYLTNQKQVMFLIQLESMEIENWSKTYIPKKYIIKIQMNNQVQLIKINLKSNKNQNIEYNQKVIKLFKYQQNDLNHLNDFRITVFKYNTTHKNQIQEEVVIKIKELQIFQGNQYLRFKHLQFQDQNQYINIKFGFQFIYDFHKLLVDIQQECKVMIDILNKYEQLFQQPSLIDDVNIIIVFKPNFTLITPNTLRLSIRY